MGRQGRDRRRGLDRQGRRRDSQPGCGQAREDPRRRGRGVEVGELLGELEVGAEAPTESSPEETAPAAAAPASEPRSPNSDGAGDRRRSREAAGRGRGRARRRRQDHACRPARRRGARHRRDQGGRPGTGGRVVKEDVLAYVERNGGDGARAGDGASAVRRRRTPRSARSRHPRARSSCEAATRCSPAT